MIDKIAKIKIEGGGFPSPCTLTVFSKPTDRVSIIYGKNGSGKTTVSNGFQALKKNDTAEFSMCSLLDFTDSEIKLSEKDRSNIHVFNEDFVDRNVRFSDTPGLKTIVMFGDQVDFDKEIESKKAELSDAKRKEENVKSKCDEFKDAENSKSPQFYVNLMRMKLREDNGWADTDRIIKGNTNKSSINLEIIQDIYNSHTKEKSKEQIQIEFDSLLKIYQTSANSSTSFVSVIKQILLVKGSEKNILSLLAHEIRKLEFSDREKAILDTIQAGHQEWIENAEILFSREVSVCPFCQQSVSALYRHDLVSEIRRVLNKDVNDHIGYLNSVSLESLVTDYSHYKIIDSELVKDIDLIAEDCNKMIAQYSVLLQKKAGNVYKPIDIDSLGLEKRIIQLNGKIIQLETKRSEYQALISKRDKMKEALIFMNKQIASFLTISDYQMYLKQTNAAKKIVIEYEKVQQLSNDITSNISQLQQKMKDVTIAKEEINKSLAYVFFSSERLKLELYDDSTYMLRSKGKIVPSKKLSTGERNVIALAYFFALVLENHSQHNRFIKPAFVLLDDPVSSFDYENKVGIHSFLSKKLHEFLEGNEKSKFVYLTHDLEAACAFEASAGMTNKVFQFLENETLAIKATQMNLYTELLCKIYQYAKDDVVLGVEEFYIGNTLRRILEAYGTFLYKKGIVDLFRCSVLLDRIKDEKLKQYFENFMCRLLLHGESHTENLCKSMPDSDFYHCFSHDEKVKTARSVLVFMKIDNPEHIVAHLKNDISSIAVIQCWEEEIKKY